jgi:hypothetical protein
MTKPDDIPQDVWNEAYGQALLFVQWIVPAPTDYVQAEHVLAVSFARAIMAAKAEERKACAVYHDDLAAQHEASREGARGPSRANHGLMMRVHLNAAAAIRKRGEAD